MMKAYPNYKVKKKEMKFECWSHKTQPNTFIPDNVLT